MKQNLRRLQALFEGCCIATMKNVPLKPEGLDFSKELDGRYSDLETEDLFSLWLSGHGQGVADHAVERGDIQL